MLKIIIITGFLGSGKTTFLKELLKNTNEKIAFLINELGATRLDDDLLKNSIINSCDTVLVNNGCLCCNKLNGLKSSLEYILNTEEKANKKLNYIIIETTGIANIAPIIYTILSDIFLSNHFCVHKIIAILDALNYKKHIKNPETINQLTSANEIIITKTDLVKDFDKNKLASINKTAFCYLKDEYNQNLFFAKANKMPFINTKQTHLNEISSLSFEFKKELDWDKFCIWLSMFLYKYAESVLRIKGILDVGLDECVSINGVYHHIYPAEHIKINPKKSNLVVIFKFLDKEKIIKSFCKFLDINENDYMVF